MTKKEKLFLNGSLALCFLTGLFIFLLKNFFETSGEFGFEEHWLLDDVKIFHYIFTPSLVVSFGLLWQGHIKKGVKTRARAKRRSGLFILGVMLLLVFTGQSLLFLVQEEARTWTGWVHSVAGLLIFLGVVRHSRRKS